MHRLWRGCAVASIEADAQLGLTDIVYGVHISSMTPLERWMDDKGWDDARLAAAIGRDRSQVNRIRRGVSGTTKEVALKIEELTGIPWHAFIAPEADAAE